MFEKKKKRKNKMTVARGRRSGDVVLLWSAASWQVAVTQRMTPQCVCVCVCVQALWCFCFSPFDPFTRLVSSSSVPASERSSPAYVSTTEREVEGEKERENERERERQREREGEAEKQQRSVCDCKTEENSSYFKSLYIKSKQRT